MYKIKQLATGMQMVDIGGQDNWSFILREIHPWF